jgi:hypothetical protein
MPRAAVGLIGADKKIFKKDFYDFCPTCFEYLFGIVVFTTKKPDSESCHVCESKIIESLPYSYFYSFYKFTDGREKLRQKKSMWVLLDQRIDTSTDVAFDS